MNGDDRDGVYRLPLSADDKGRASATRYLTQRVRDRPNLLILADAEVRRLVVDNRRATGVDVQLGGMLRRLETKLVVLAAGAVHSPALLMQSGIGPARRLRGCDLTVVHDLAGVGSNLQNHAFLHLGSYLNKSSRQAASLPNYVTAAMRFSSGMAGAPRSDMMIGIIARPGFHPGGNALALLGVHLYAPFSRGRIGIKRKDGGLEPEIDFRLLSDMRDRKRLSAAAGLAATLLRAPALAAMVRDPFLVPAAAPIRALNAPGTASRLRTLGLAAIAGLPGSLRRAATRMVVPHARFLDETQGLEFDEAVERSALPMFHVAGTCAMGGVVKPDLSVMGIDALYVADASVMPNVPRANTNLATMMIAERAATLLRDALR